VLIKKKNGGEMDVFERLRWCVKGTSDEDYEGC